MLAYQVMGEGQPDSLQWATDGNEVVSEVPLSSATFLAGFKLDTSNDVLSAKSLN